METFNHVCSNHRRMRKGFFGAFIIAAGVLILLHNIGRLPDNIFNFFISWQMLLIAIGFVNVLSKVSRFIGIVMISIGTFFILPQLIPFGIDFDQLFWPVIIIAVGVVMIFKVFTKHNHPHHFMKDTTNLDAGYINENNVFSGGKYRVSNVEFKGGKISNIFGGAEIDLTQATLAPGKNVLDVSVIFGGIKLVVPSDWIIHIEVTSIMGGFADKRQVVKTDGTYSTRELFIRGSAIFGGGEIKSY